MFARALALLAALLLATASTDTRANAYAHALSLKNPHLGFLALELNPFQEKPPLSPSATKEKSLEIAAASIGRENYLRARYMDPGAGRFLGLDPSTGDGRVPQSLHDFAYVHNFPTIGVDPSGTTLAELSARLYAMAALSVASYLSLDFILRGQDSIVSSASRSVVTLWDVLAINQFKSKIKTVGTDPYLSAEIIALLASSPQGHHTIPVYLCGSMNQQLAYIPHADHVAIHAGIAAIELVMLGAEQYAWTTLGRTRLGSALRMAGTNAGRLQVTYALDQIYRAGWDQKGYPVTIRAAFDRERIPYELGVKTSLPWCTRFGSP